VVKELRPQSIQPEYRSDNKYREGVIVEAVSFIGSAAVMVRTSHTKPSANTSLMSIKRGQAIIGRLNTFRQIELPKPSPSFTVSQMVTLSEARRFGASASAEFPVLSSRNSNNRSGSGDPQAISEDFMARGNETPRLGQLSLNRCTRDVCTSIDNHTVASPGGLRTRRGVTSSIRGKAKASLSVHQNYRWIGDVLAMSNMLTEAVA